MNTLSDRRKERSKATREALLRIAAPLFARRGFEGTSLEDLAREAGVNKALVQYHFGGKQGLYSAVLRQAIRVGAEEMRSVAESAANAETRLEMYIEAFQRFARRVPHFPFMMLREEMGGGAHIEADVLAEFLQFFSLDRKIIEQGRREGVFREVNPHASHLSLVGAIVFFLVSQPVRDRAGQLRGFPADNPVLDQYIGHVKRLFLLGLQKERESSRRGPRGGR
jgi:AcrR family transcriptional regulator